LRVSIVIACRNEKKHIRSFLDSVVSQETQGADWEIIVADGISDDGTTEILREYQDQCPRLQVIPNPGRIVSTGLNAAILAAGGEIIIRMDAHTRYSPDYCRVCLETLEETQADNVGGPARTEASGYLASAVAAAYHSPFSTGGAGFHNPNREGYVDTVPYGCWRRSTLLRLGLFDPALVRNQDDELNLRILRGGGRIWQSPRIRSWYTPRSSLSGLFRQYCQYGYWKVAVIRKHLLPGSWRHLVPGLFVLANVLLLLLLATGATFGAAWRWAPLRVWAALAGSYALATIAASMATARKSGWRLMLVLPAVFLMYHVSYGLGFLIGLFSFPINSTRPVISESVFSRITR
jgi:succinoglycan biosynthesis protein ExoA